MPNGRHDHAVEANASPADDAGTTPGFQTTVYSVDGENQPGGAAVITSHTSRIAFDGSAGSGGQIPGPADLLAAALAACILKNVERFSVLLPFRYQRASIHVELERDEPPPRIVRARYALRIATDEPQRRLQLLERNILRSGTITNTLAAACDLEGRILAEPTDN
ncbi:MAG: OsmC family protein [Solirubrobacteraceae bacterium]